MYHYTESGLRNVWLANGYSIRTVAGEKAVSIADADGLHLAIGRIIARKPRMTGAELRFIRKELGLSQVRLGQMVGASEEAVSLWERRGKVPLAADRVIRAVYLEKVNGNVQFVKMVEELANLDRQEQERLVLEETDAGWKEAA